MEGPDFRSLVRSDAARLLRLRSGNSLSEFESPQPKPKPEELRSESPSRSDRQAAAAAEQQPAAAVTAEPQAVGSVTPVNGETGNSALLHAKTLVFGEDEEENENEDEPGQRTSDGARLGDGKSAGVAGVRSDAVESPSFVVPPSKPHEEEGTFEASEVEELSLPTLKKRPATKGVNSQKRPAASDSAEPEPAAQGVVSHKRPAVSDSAEPEPAAKGVVSYKRPAGSSEPSPKKRPKPDQGEAATGGSDAAQPVKNKRLPGSFNPADWEWTDLPLPRTQDGGPRREGINGDWTVRGSMHYCYFTSCYAMFLKPSFFDVM